MYFTTIQKYFKNAQIANSDKISNHCDIPEATETNGIIIDHNNLSTQNIAIKYDNREYQTSFTTQFFFPEISSSINYVFVCV